MTRDLRHLWLAEIAPDATDDDDYQPATPEENRAGVRAVHEVLYGRPLELPHAVGPGTCHDCHTERDVIFEYGHVEVCARCAHERHTIATRNAKDEAA